MSKKSKLRYQQEQEALARSQENFQNSLKILRDQENLKIQERNNTIMSQLLNNTQNLTNEKFKETFNKSVDNSIEYLNRIYSPEYDVVRSGSQKGDIIDNYKITSTFGLRNTGILGATTNHQGTDYGTPIDTPLYGSGKIIEINQNPNLKTGKYISILKPNNDVIRYLHLNKIPENLTVGMDTTGQDIVAYTGNTGVGGQPHLHADVYNANDKIKISTKSNLNNRRDITKTLYQSEIFNPHKSFQQKIDELNKMKY